MSNLSVSDVFYLDGIAVTDETLNISQMKDRKLPVEFIMWLPDEKYFLLRPNQP